VLAFLVAKSDLEEKESGLWVMVEFVSKATAEAAAAATAYVYTCNVQND
jgi:hypothetical protein